jgi:hypothetical protein
MRSSDGHAHFGLSMGANALIISNYETPEAFVRVRCQRLMLLTKLRVPQQWGI